MRHVSAQRARSPFVESPKRVASNQVAIPTRRPKSPISKFDLEYENRYQQHILDVQRDRLMAPRAPIKITSQLNYQSREFYDELKLDVQQTTNALSHQIATIVSIY